MSLAGNQMVTLSDVAKRLDKDGKIDKIVELLTQTNEILDDMTFIEGNLPTGHKTTIRTGLPSAAWRLLNYGVAQSKSTTQAVTDTCGMLESYSEIDKSLAELNSNTAAFRLSEDRAFLEAMNQEMAKTLFYGDTEKTPERFLGLAPRFSSLDTKKNANAINIIDAKGTGTKLTSIWLVSWGEQTVHGIYPKGSTAGFTHTDFGEVTIIDDKGGKYQGYRTHYKWDIGLTVRDWRYIVRIANIDLATITDEDFVKCMVMATEQLPNLKLGSPVFYMNKETRTGLRLAQMNHKNVHMTYDTVGGKLVQRFDEIPVKRCDGMLKTESRVIA